MLAVAENVSLAEFQSKFEKGERSCEFWYGQVMSRNGTTWVHGFLRGIVSQLLTDAGYAAGSNIQLRIVPDARPKPDIIATKGAVEDVYPSSAVDVVVEILSPDDAMAFVLEKCRAYEAWGFPGIYVVEPANRLIFRWTGHALEVCDLLTTIPTSLVWERLDLALRRKP